MTYETKNIAFSHNTCESEQQLSISRTLTMNVAIESARIIASEIKKYNL